jgi:tetratricopeptide (TPR) repeat protein
MAARLDPAQELAHEMGMIKETTARRYDAMAKKKRKGDRRKQPSPQEMPRLPDPRVMEQFMQLAAGPPGEADHDTPLAKAHNVLLHAYQEQDEQRRIQLANKALEICPDCADAYVLLAEHAPSRKDALELYEKGVAAGERALGPEVFQRAVGHFWGLPETRPYMRARLGLAHALWVAGRREEAVLHLQNMLCLNPEDNQGIRYTLAGFLLSLDRDDDLATLLQQYPEEASAAWSYTTACQGTGLLPSW